MHNRSLQKKLTNIGFDAQMSSIALSFCNNNLQSAIEFMLNQQQSIQNKVMLHFYIYILFYTLKSINFICITDTTDNNGL